MKKRIMFTAIIAIAVIAGFLCFESSRILQSRPFMELKLWWTLKRIDYMEKKSKKPHYSYQANIEVPLGKAIQLSPESKVWIELTEVHTNAQRAGFVVHVKNGTDEQFIGEVALSNNFSFCPAIAPKAISLQALTTTNAVITVRGSVWK